MISSGILLPFIYWGLLHNPRTGNPVLDQPVNGMTFWDLFHTSHLPKKTELGKFYISLENTSIVEIRHVESDRSGFCRRPSLHSDHIDGYPGKL